MDVDQMLVLNDEYMLLLSALFFKVHNVLFSR